MPKARITIEFDAEGGKVIQGEQEAPAATGAGAQPPADVLATAAAIGAQNAGAAPSFGGETPGAPEPFSAAGDQPAGADSGSSSAGAAPGAEGDAPTSSEMGSAGDGASGA